MNEFSFILKENVLTDDVLKASKKGYKYKGGYIAYIEQNTFKNAWSDNKEIIFFRSKKSLEKYINKHYPDFEFYNDIENTYLN